MKKIFLGLGLLLGGIGLVGAELSAPSFDVLGTYRGPGTLGWQGPSVQPPGVLIGPGEKPGTERLYLAYTYSGQKDALDVLVVDPETGAWRRLVNPVSSEYGACMILGPDGNIYLGTRPSGHILRLNPHTGVMVDLGQPAPDEHYSFIYQMAVASDGNIYASTYPSARLLRCDPKTGRLADLGRVAPDEKEQYALWLAASRDGFVYEAVGTARAHLIAQNLASGERRDLLQQIGGYVAAAGAEVGNIPFVYRGDDGEIYAIAGERHFRVRGWTMEPISADQARPEMPAHRLADGRTVVINDREIQITDAKTGTITRRALGYEGRESPIFRLGAGPGGRLFGSSILPLHILEVDLAEPRISDFGRLSHGEVYSFLTLRDNLYMASYDGPRKIPLMAYDPTRPFVLGTDATSNPRLVDYAGSRPDWRPQAMVTGPDGKLFIGSVASYGNLDGPLTVWNPANHEVQRFEGVVPHQSIVSLAAIDGLIVGGTTVFGGGGSQPTEKEAKLFIWDPRRHESIWQGVPVAGANRITDLLPLPDGRIIGIALRESNDRLNEFHLTRDPGIFFVFNLKSRRIDHAEPFPWAPMYNSLALADDGKAWGLVREGIFRYDPQTGVTSLVAKSPKPVTAGFALMNGQLYFAAGATVYRYRLP